MQKIGFFGGCFSPISNIHIKIANNLIEEKKLDKVVFVPVNDFYNKDKLALAEHRLNMIKLAIKDYKNLKVEDIEIKENKKMYAVDAFELLYKKYKDTCEIFFIMGSDNFNNMHNWKNYNEIKDKYNYVIIQRNSKDVTSTQIREMIKNKDKEVKNYLSLEVYKYIIEKELYKL